jgi:hypothetical protein
MIQNSAYVTGLNIRSYTALTVYVNAQPVIANHRNKYALPPGTQITLNDNTLVKSLIFADLVISEQAEKSVRINYKN